jgi:hypothetical protein
MIRLRKQIRLRPEPILTEFHRDDMGFLHARLTNRAGRGGSVNLELSVPAVHEGHWIARVDPGGNPLMDQGRFIRVPTTDNPYMAELTWTESALQLPTRGRSVDLRFFVGYASALDLLPVRFRLTNKAGVIVKAVAEVRKGELAQSVPSLGVEKRAGASTLDGA